MQSEDSWQWNLREATISRVPTHGKVTTIVKKAWEMVIHVFIIYNKNKPTNFSQWWKNFKKKKARHVKNLFYKTNEISSETD